MALAREYDREIRAHYHMGGALGVQAHVPKGEITDLQIQRRANTLGIQVNDEVTKDNISRGHAKRQTQSLWEVQGWNDVLRRAYSRHGLPYVMSLIPRNSVQISVQTSKLGLKLSPEALFQASTPKYRSEVKRLNAIRKGSSEKAPKPNQMEETPSYLFLTQPAPESVYKGQTYASR